MKGVANLPKLLFLRNSVCFQNLNIEQIFVQQTLKKVCKNFLGQFLENKNLQTTFNIH